MTRGWAFMSCGQLAGMTSAATFKLASPSICTVTDAPSRSRLQHRCAYVQKLLSISKFHLISKPPASLRCSSIEYKEWRPPTEIHRPFTVHVMLHHHSSSPD